MRKEYDFSKGERGKFYRPDIELNLPIYLDPDVAPFVQRMAAEKGVEVTAIVNGWLREQIGRIEAGSK
jgi:hypothetical protein